MRRFHFFLDMTNLVTGMLELVLLYILYLILYDCLIVLKCLNIIPISNLSHANGTPLPTARPSGLDRNLCFNGWFLI